MNQHLPRLLERYPVLRSCEADLVAALELLVAVYRSGGALLVCGNGGSAADSEHLVGELLKGFQKRRRIPPADRAKLETVAGASGAAIGEQLQGSLRAFSLVSQTSLITATANDIGGDMIFAQQVFGLGRPGDAMLAISTSGKSANVINAAVVARAFGLKTIGLTGRTGGPLADVVDVAIRVPADRVADVQELHLPVYHWLAIELEDEFFPDDAAQ